MTFNVMRLCALNVCDTATPSMTTADSAYPATNLQDPSRTEARTTSVAADREFKWTWASSQRINWMGLFRHNFTGAATIAWTFYSDAAWTTAISGATSGTITAFNATLLGRMMSAEGVYSQRLRALKNSVYEFAQVYTNVRSVKAVVNDGANADGHLAVGRAFGGEYLALDRSAAFGAGCEWVEEAERRRRRSGALRTTARLPEQFRRWSLPMPPVDSADRALLSELSWYAGERRDMFFSLYPGNGTILELENQGLVKFVARGRLAHIVPSHWQTDFTLEEA